MKLLGLVLVVAACGGGGGGNEQPVDGNNSDGKPGDGSHIPPIDAPMQVDAGPTGTYNGPTDGNRCSESNWCPIEPAIPVTLRSMSGTGPNDVWAVGEGGTLLHYDGTKWTRVPAQTHDEMAGVYSAEVDDVWAVSTTAAYHFNGTTWTKVTIADLSYPYAISGSGSSSVWIAEYGGTTHHWNGSTWTKYQTPGSEYLYAIYGTANDAWVAGSTNSLYHFNGSSWQAYASPSSSSTDTFVGMWGHASNDIWLTDGGTGWHWDGSTWTANGSLSYAGTIKPLWGRASNDVWSPGGNYSLDHWNGSAWSQVNPNLDGQGTIYQGLSGFSASATDVWFTTVYGGLVHGDGTTFAWSDFPSKIQNRNAIWSSAANNVWAVGDGPARHFDGNAWSDQTLPPTSTLRAVYGLAANNVYAAGDSGSLLHFDGTAWTKISGIPTTTWNLYAIWASSASDVYAIGYLGNLSHFDGTTWTSAWSGATTNHVYGLYGFSATDIWGVAQSGTIIHKDANGWTKSTHGTYDLLAVWGIASNDVWAVGQFGATFHWDGTAWSAVATPATADYAYLSAVRGRASNDVWAAGSNGAMYHWDGTSWTRALSGSSSRVNGMTIAGTTLYSAGDYGTLMTGP